MKNCTPFSVSATTGDEDFRTGVRRAFSCQTGSSATTDRLSGDRTIRCRVPIDLQEERMGRSPDELPKRMRRRSRSVSVRTAVRCAGSARGSHDETGRGL